MGIGLKMIASSEEPLQLTDDQNVGFQGLAGYSNEDPHVAVSCMHLQNQTPTSAREVRRLGARIEKNSINQVQDLGPGNIPSAYWFAASRCGLMPGNTVAAGAYCATPKNTVATEVLASFVLPALDANVQITVDDTTGFTVGDFDNNAANTGVFCGGRFWDVISIDSATTMTLRLRDAFGAVVTMLG